MKKQILSIAILCSFGLSAHAQTESSPWRGVLGLGITSGGDKLATAVYTNGSSSNVTAGSGLQLYIGAEYRLGERVSLQATAGYHSDFTPRASNGDLKFSRYPLEFLGYYRLANQWRIGAGARFVMSPELKGTGAASNLNRKFDDTTGAIIEVEYMATSNLGIKLRGVSEKFKPTNSSTSFSGDHVGLLGNFYF